MKIINDKIRQLPFVAANELSHLSDKDDFKISLIMYGEKVTFFEAYRRWESTKKGLGKFIK